MSYLDHSTSLSSLPQDLTGPSTVTCVNCRVGEGGAQQAYCERTLLKGMPTLKLIEVNFMGDLKAVETALKLSEAAGENHVDIAAADDGGLGALGLYDRWVHELLLGLATDSPLDPRRFHRL